MEIGSEVFVIVVGWQRVGDGVLNAQTDSCLVGPTPRHILHCVAAATENEQRQAPRLHQLDAFGVAFNCAVMGAKFVVGKGIGTTLDNNCIRSESLPHFFHHSLIDIEVGLVIDASFEGHID